MKRARPSTRARELDTSTRARSRARAPVSCIHIMYSSRARARKQARNYRVEYIVRTQTSLPRGASQAVCAHKNRTGLPLRAGLLNSCRATDPRRHPQSGRGKRRTRRSRSILRRPFRVLETRRGSNSGAQSTQRRLSYNLLQGRLVVVAPRLTSAPAWSEQSRQHMQLLLGRMWRQRTEPLCAQVRTELRRARRTARQQLRCANHFVTRALSVCFSSNNSACALQVSTTSTVAPSSASAPPTSYTSVDAAAAVAHSSHGYPAHSTSTGAEVERNAVAASIEVPHDFTCPITQEIMVASPPFPSHLWCCCRTWVRLLTATCRFVDGSCHMCRRPQLRA